MLAFSCQYLQSLKFRKVAKVGKLVVTWVSLQVPATETV